METVRLAGDIEKGLCVDISPLVLVEDRGYDILVAGRTCRVCVLCIAAIGRFGTVEAVKDSYRAVMEHLDRTDPQRGKASHIEILAKLANCEVSLALSVQHAHIHGMKAAQIASNLRTDTLPVWRPR